jgi:hypothetical protein
MSLAVGSLLNADGKQSVIGQRLSPQEAHKILTKKTFKWNSNLQAKLVPIPGEIGTLVCVLECKACKQQFSCSNPNECSIAHMRVCKEAPASSRGGSVSTAASSIDMDDLCMENQVCTHAQISDLRSGVHVHACPIGDL